MLDLGAGTGLFSVDRIQWLREAGFTKADCVFKSFFVGVFQGMKE